MGKSWSDIVDSNMTIFDYTFNSDGTVSTDYMDQNDESITYSIDDNNTLTLIHSYCYDNNECDDEWRENLVLDSQTGEVSRYNHYINIELVSSSPIVKMDSYPTYRTLSKPTNPISIYDEMVKRRLEQLKKRWF